MLINYKISPQLCLTRPDVIPPLRRVQAVSKGQAAIGPHDHARNCQRGYVRLCPHVVVFLVRDQIAWVNLYLRCQRQSVGDSRRLKCHRESSIALVAPKLSRDESHLIRCVQSLDAMAFAAKVPLGAIHILCNDSRTA